MKEKTELKPCPFCGSDRVTVAAAPEDFVFCRDCYAEGPNMDTGQREAAITAWNTRVSEKEESNG